LAFQWDQAKNRTNWRKHAIRFQTAARIFNGPVIQAPDDREDYGEQRFIAIGDVDARVVVVTYAFRGKDVRLISARKATRHEAQEYYEAIYGQ
jgi:uncharacterized DUF497 family protein